MSSINFDVVVALFVIVNMILLAASLQLGSSQSKLSLDDIMPKQPDNSEDSASKA